MEQDDRDMITAIFADGTSFDGCGGVSGIFVNRGKRYRFSAEVLYPYRVLRLVEGQPDEVIKEGETTMRPNRWPVWVPPDSGVTWNDPEIEGLAFEVKPTDASGWERMAEYGQRTPEPAQG